MSQVSVLLQSLFWAVMAFFGVEHFPKELQVWVAPAVAGLTGIFGPAILEWKGKAVKYAPTISTVLAVAGAAVAWLVAKQHMNQDVAGVIVAAITGLSHFLIPSSGHPSRLPVVP
jgi:hypothetical protein